MNSFLFLDRMPNPGLKIQDNGILSAPARIARAGVYRYLINGEIANVLREPAVVESTAGLFDNRPVTLDHPPNKEVTIANKDKLTKGWGSKVKYVDGWLETEINIFASDAIEAAKTTHQEFSNGYSAKLVPEQGIWVDELGIQGDRGRAYSYEYKQIPEKGNHIALVSNNTARAGSGATFLVDNQDIDGVIIDSMNMSSLRMGDSTYQFDSAMLPLLEDMFGCYQDMGKSCDYADMQPITLGDKSMMAPKNCADMMNFYGDALSKKATQRMADSSEYIHIDAYKQLEATVRTLQAQIGTANANLQIANQKLADSLNQDKLNQIIEERSESFNRAKAFVTDSFDPKIESIEWLKKALVARNVVIEGFNDAQINAAFNVLVATSDSRPTYEPNPIDKQIAALRKEPGNAMSMRTLPQNRHIPAIV